MIVRDALMQPVRKVLSATHFKEVSIRANKVDGLTECYLSAFNPSSSRLVVGNAAGFHRPGPLNLPPRFLVTINSHNPPSLFRRFAIFASRFFVSFRLALPVTSFSQPRPSVRITLPGPSVLRHLYLPCRPLLALPPSLNDAHLDPRRTLISLCRTLPDIYPISRPLRLLYRSPSPPPKAPRPA